MLVNNVFDKQYYPLVTFDELDIADVFLPVCVQSSGRDNQS